MRFNLRLITVSAVIAFVLPAVYGMTDCEDAVDIPTITAPQQLSTIAASGLFTASVDFPITLTAASFVQMEIQTNQGLTVIDVTSQFLPPGQSDFAGADSASADLDAVALGMTPGVGQRVVDHVDPRGVPVAQAGRDVPDRVGSVPLLLQSRHHFDALSHRDFHQKH